MSLPLIPEHTLLRIIGKGSYGEVWLAVNGFGSYRAIKVVTRSQFRTAKPFERELSGIKKFEPISRSHPGFIPVLQVGYPPERDFFYTVMELADDDSNGPFDPESYEPRCLRSKALPISECIKIGISLGEALQYLHQNGLIHRDVKPSNILFIKGVPKLADVGMVAGLDDTLSFVGTEGFIPPEGPGTIQADIYSLGKVLYEIGTGRDRVDFPAYPDPAAFPEWDNFLELNEVLVKACHTDKNKRYQGADELVSDLKALSSGKSILRLRRLERQAFVAKRVVLVGVLAAILAALIFVPIYQQVRFRRDERARQTGRNIAFGVQNLNEGEYYTALPFLLRGMETDSPGREKTHLVRLSSVISECPKISWMTVRTSAVLHVEFSSDGLRLLISTREGSATSYRLDGSVPPLTMHHPALRQACFGPGGVGFVTAGRDHCIRVWNAEGGLEHCLTNQDQIYALAVSPIGSFIATAGSDGSVVVWDLRANKERYIIKQTNAVQCIAFSPDGKLLASGSEDNTCNIWSVDTGQLVLGPLIHENWVTGVAFSPDSKRLATGSIDRKVRVWDSERGRELIPALRMADAISSVAFSQDGEYLLAGSYDWAARVFDSHSGDLLAPVLPQSGRVMDARFDRESRRIVIACWDGSIRVYDLTTIRQPINRGKAISTPDLRQFATSEETIIAEFKDTISGNVIGGAKLPESSKCIGITPTAEGALGVYVGKSGRYIAESGGKIVEINKDVPAIKSFVSDGKWIGLQTLDDVAIVNRSGELLGQLPVPAQEGPSFIFSDKAPLLLSWREGTLQLWDLTNKFRMRWKVECEAPIASGMFSPDGSRIVVAEQDLLLEKRVGLVLNTIDGSRACPPLQHLDGVLRAEFSPDGNQIVTAGEEFAAFVFDGTTGKPLSGPMKHQHQVRWASFSSDSRWVVTASRDHTMRVWEALSGDPLTPPFWHGEELRKACFLSNNRYVAVQTMTGKLVVWNLDEIPNVVDYLNPLIALTTRKQLDDWQPNWNQLQQFQKKHPSSDLQHWHRQRAQDCADHGNFAGQSFHLKFLGN